MAIYTPAGDVNGDSDTASTWYTVSSPHTPSGTDTSNLSSSNKGEMEFTAPNTSNDSIGVMIPLESDVNADGIEVELQEYDGATWTTKATGSADLNAYYPSGATLDSGWIRIEWGTSYTYTTTTANYYRVRVWGSSGQSLRLWQPSGSGSGYDCWLYVIDDRTGVPGDGDQIYAMGSAETSISFKIVGTQTVGVFNGTASETALQNPTQNYDAGVVVGFNCTINIDTTADVNFTCKGYFVHIYGDIVYGSEGSQPTNNVTLTFHTNGSNDAYGYWLCGSGTINLWGNSEKTIAMFYDSGDGSTGDPLVVDSTWAVGDRLVVASGTTGQYNDYEVKFIKTKPTSTTATLSDTDGGAESAFSNTYDTDGIIKNFTRDLVFTTDNGYDASVNFNGNPDTTSLTATSAIRGAEFQNINQSGVRNGFYIGDTSGRATRLTLSFCTWYQGGIYSRTIDPLNIEDTVTHDTSAHVTITGRGTTIRRLWSSGTSSSRPLYIEGANHYVEDFKARCCCTNFSSVGGAIWIVEAQRPVLIDIDIKTTRRRSLTISGSSVNVRIFDSNIGGEDTSIDIVSGVYVTMYLEGTTLSAPTDFEGLSTAGSGSEIYFDEFATTTNDHRLYTAGGKRYTTGSGLSDTLTRTAGNLSLKYEPTDATDGVFEEFLILSNANSTAAVNFYARRTSALTNAKFELFLRGSSTADDSVTWDNTITADEWKVVSLAGDWTSSEPRYATVRITAQSTTGSLYVADIFNGENDITGLNTYFEGQIGPVMFPQIADVGAISAAVWADNATYASGQKGKVLEDGADSAELASIK